MAVRKTAPKKASTTARATRQTPDTKPAEAAPIVDPPATGKPVDVTAPEPEPSLVTSPFEPNTGRPNDTPISAPEEHFTMTTFADRAKTRAAKERAAAKE